MGRLHSSRVVFALAGVAGIAAGASGQVGIFELHKERAAFAAVTLTAAEPSRADLAGTPMLRALHGVVGQLGPKELIELRASTGPALSKAVSDPGQTYAFVHLWPKDPSKVADGHASEHKVVRLVRLADGEWVAEELATAAKAGAAPPRRLTLKSEVIAPLASGWMSYRGDLKALMPAEQARPEKAKAERVGEVFELSKPYEPGLYTMTARVLGERLLAGGVTSLKPTTRELASSTLHARLPKGYKPAAAAGLIVWCDASPSGRPPSTFDAVADELGFIVAGAADAGNERLVVDRYQLAMDVLATVQSRYLIDPMRVYTSGISGGGRVSSTLAACFPELIDGTAPIVGLATYENVPKELGQYWPAGFRRPPLKIFEILRTRRIAPITGEKDFNYQEILGAITFYERDRCQIKLYSTPEMGHQMPTPERFAEAMRWVDEPAAVARGGAIVAAKAKLAAIKSHNGAAPLTDEERATLVGVTGAAPWSEPAWEAAAMLER